MQCLLKVFKKVYQNQDPKLNYLYQNEGLAHKGKLVKVSTVVLIEKYLIDYIIIRIMYLQCFV